VTGVSKRTLVLALLACGFALAPLGAQATAPGPLGPIVYVQNGTNDIAVVSATGTDMRVSTQPGRSPTWSPASQQIAYVDDPLGQGQVRVMTFSGTAFGAPTAVPGATPADSVAWSPDGATLAYTDGTNIFTIKPDGSSKTQLTFGSAANVDPTWSPDGSEIAFSSDRDDGAGDIYVMSSSDGRNQTKLTSSAAADTQPSWSPGGTTIVFASDRDGVDQIYKVPSTGGSEVRLTNEAVDDADPSWSPTGAQIVLVRNGNTLATMSSSGGTVTAFSPAVSGTQPEWGLGFGPLSPPSISPSSGFSIGTVLTASNGSWSASPNSYTYQWQRCNSSGGSCTTISGATNQTYTLTTADDGFSFRVTVTATANAGTASSTSPPTSVFQSTLSATGQAPSLISSPTITVTPPFGSTAPADGSILVGSSVFASVGSWRGQFPITFAYSWQKCDPATGFCFTIPLATTSSFVAPIDLYGWQLAIRITATNSLGTVSIVSFPTGKISAVAPRLSVTPPITGSNTVGETLSVGTGTWTGTVPITYAYEWRRCDPQGSFASCVAIAGARSSTYTLTPADQGVALRVWITATNVQGAVTGITNHTLPTLPKPRFAPTATSAPSITGIALPGERLTADRGAWTGDATISYVLLWQRCDATGAACAVIPDASKTTYLVVAKDVGSTMRVLVTAKNPVGTSSAISAATDTVHLTPHRKGRRIVGTSRSDYLGGSGGDDVMLGRRGNDTLAGGAGNDRIDGGEGNDVVIGGTGNDVLQGGIGSDTIMAADGSRDTVDCGVGNDRVVVDAIDVVKNCEAVQTVSSDGSSSTSITTTATTTSTSKTTTTAKP
jgi:hypothetical protein